MGGLIWSKKMKETYAEYKTVPFFRFVVCDDAWEDLKLSVAPYKAEAGVWYLTCCCDLWELPTELGTVLPKPPIIVVGHINKATD